MRIRIICHKVQNQFKCGVLVNGPDFLNRQRSLRQKRKISNGGNTTYSLKKIPTAASRFKGKGGRWN